MATAFLTHPDFLRHDTGPSHPERPARLTAIASAIEKASARPDSIFDGLIRLEPDLADTDRVKAVHDTRYVEAVPVWCQRGLRNLPTGDTPICPESYHVALRAVGAVLQAVDAVAAGTVRNAFCAVRPPGHHAEREGGMGFCIFNNAAAAARYAQQRRGWARVLILDWDVHHGNGTQHIFEDDPTVLYISLHQHPLYPFTGMTWETGVGAGAGYTVNVPMPAGAGDAEYRSAFEDRVLPAANAFAPDLVLISAGFDAHRDDPLSRMEVTEAGFDYMLRAIMDVARVHCEGRIVSVLEGGYDAAALARCVERHLRILLEG